MFQRLRITLVQVKTGDTSENLVNVIRQIIYSLNQGKEITKKAYNKKNEFNKVIKQNGCCIYEHYYLIFQVK